MSSAAQIVEFRDEARRAELLRKIPKQWRRRVGAIHAGKIARAGAVRHEIARRYEIERESDGWLFAMAAKVEGLRVPVDISDSELCSMAADCARKAMSLGEFAPGYHVADAGALRARLNAYVQGFGITPPAPYKPNDSAKGFSGVEDGAALARMTGEIWWRRALRREQGRQLERAAISLGYVHKAAEIYASNATVERRGQQRRRNAAGLESTEAVNLDTGEVCNLAKLAESTVANPRIRRGELMTRISGFEYVARGLGHVAEFVTLTCPSVFHARRVVGGRTEENPKHDGSTPRDAARYLSKVWARIRAKFARMNLGVYGFRIAEPHHDACPHWHLLLFMPALMPSITGAIRATVPRFRAIFRHHAMRQDGDEQGAAANRIKFVSIDPGEGTAAGYVAKYVSKNIDGGGVVVNTDLAGDPVIDMSQRVEAWASTWGIRQFQQVGGPPVGVWRELRRLPKGDYSVRVEAARKAADCGPISREEGGEKKTAENWAAYVAAQGGPVVKRADLPVVLAKTAPGERLSFDAAGDPAPYPAPLNRYGEVAPGAVVGVRDAVKDKTFYSMRARWEIKRSGAVSRADARVTGNGGSSGCTPAGAATNPGISAGAASFGFSLSRTRGNNCTQPEFGATECPREIQQAGVDRAEKERLFEWFLSRETAEGVRRWIN